MDFNFGKSNLMNILWTGLILNECYTREMGRNRKSASLITQSVLIISIENSFVLALIRSLEKIQKKTARHAKKAGFYMAMA